MISASFPAEEPAERASSSHFPLPAQDPQVPKQPAGGAAEEEPQSSPAPSPEPPVRAEEQDGSESPAPESERDVQTETSEASAQPQAPMVYVPGAMSQAQISAYNSSLQGFLAARLSAVRALVNRDRPDPEEENKAWEVVEAATPLDRIRAFYPNFAQVFHMIVKIIYRELKINGYSYDFVRDLKSRQRNPEHMSLDAILIEAGASPREMKEKFASNPQEREDLEAYILLAAVLLIKTFKPDPWTEKYKTIPEFLEAYPELADEQDKDTLVSLQLFANVMVNVLRYINGKGNQQRLLTLVACLSEGPQHSRYITGGAQSKKTARRVMIYRRESNTHKISRPRRSRDRRQADNDPDAIAKKVRQAAAQAQTQAQTAAVPSSFNVAHPTVKREPGLPIPPAPMRAPSDSGDSVVARSVRAALRELTQQKQADAGGTTPAQASTSGGTDAGPTPQTREMTPLELLYASAQKMQAAEPPIPTKKRAHPAFAGPPAKHPAVDRSTADGQTADGQQTEAHVQPSLAALPPFMFTHSAPYPMHHAPGMVAMQRDGQPGAAPMPYPVMAAYGADPRMYDEQRRQMATAYPVSYVPYHPPPTESGAAGAPAHPVMYGPPLMMPYPMPHPTAPTTSQDGSAVKTEGAHPPPMHPYYTYPPMMPAYMVPPPPGGASAVYPQQQASSADAAASRPEQAESASSLLSASTVDSMDTVNALLSLSASGKSAALASK